MIATHSFSGGKQDTAMLSGARRVLIRCLLIAFLGFAFFLHGFSQNQRTADTTKGKEYIDEDTTMTGPLHEAQKLVPDSARPTAIDSLPKDSSISAVVLKKHSAGRGVWMSAILPGLGQAYNKKYWKIPIIYAGFAGLGYAIYYTASNFNGARNAYRDAVDEDPGTVRTYKGYSGAAELKTYRDYYSRYLNLACIFTVVWYGLNLLDAAVDGHLYYYNMNDKLSFSVDPDVHFRRDITASSSLGLRLTLKL